MKVCMTGIQLHYIVFKNNNSTITSHCLHQSLYIDGQYYANNIKDACSRIMERPVTRLTEYFIRSLLLELKHANYVHIKHNYE